MSEAPDGTAPAETEDTSLAESEALINGAPETAEADDQPADDAGAETEGEAPKPRKSAQERINEITRQKHEADRRAEEAERRIAYLEGLTKGREGPQPASSAPQEEQEPDPADYEYGETDVAFIRAHATFHARKAAREEFAQQTAERDARERATRAEEQWSSSVERAKAAHPDWQQVVSRPGWPSTQDMTAAIKESELGGEIAYHLASNPDEARRIAGLSPHSQVREIGKLEARLSAPAAPQPKTVTNAPAPTPQVRGAGGQFKPAPDTDDFSAFEKAYP